MTNLKHLAFAVIIQTARDMHSPILKIQKQAMRDVARGGLDLYFEILGIKMSKKDFVSCILNLSSKQTEDTDNTNALIRKIIRGSKF